MAADLNMVSDGRLVKMEVDYSAEVDKVLPLAEAKVTGGKLQEGLDMLLSLEKQSRLASDMRSNTRLQTAIVQMCYKAKNFKLLNECILALTKKRSLIKQAVSKMVQECCKYVEEITDEKTKLELVDTLRTVTAGKIYVEVERARLTYRLAVKKEAEGNLDEACKIMLELQLETYGSMEKQEKAELLLEQMRLCLAKKDYVRTSIISRKISIKFFADSKTEVQQLKLKYYQLMIELDQVEAKYLNICRHYMAIYNTPMVQNDNDRMTEALKYVALYLLLAPHDNEQHDLLFRLMKDKNLEKLPDYKDLLKLLTTQELIDWKSEVVDKFQAILIQGTTGSPPTNVFDLKSESGLKRWEDFQTRIVEHNIRMLAKYYTRIRLSRMSQLLHWPESKTEEFFCKLVVNGTIPGAKIDRPSGIVNFQPKKSATEVLDDWSSKVKNLMDSLNKCSHLIIKEEMVHKHLHATTSSSA